MAGGSSRDGELELRLTVRDTGIGIAKEKLRSIFEPFEQVIRPGDPAGTGLGLTITRRFVEMMGGSLRVESEVGRGSCFTFELPVELARESEIGGEGLAEGLPFILASGQPVSEAALGAADAAQPEGHAIEVRISKALLM